MPIKMTIPHALISMFRSSRVCDSYPQRLVVVTSEVNVIAIHILVHRQYQTICQDPRCLAGSRAEQCITTHVQRNEKRESSWKQENKVCLEQILDHSVRFRDP